MPTSAERPGSSDLPNTSVTQISALCSGTVSSPTIQNAAIERGESRIAHRISIRPPAGVQPQWVGCCSLTVWPG